jgi:hypothetical protein
MTATAKIIIRTIKITTWGEGVGIPSAFIMYGNMEAYVLPSSNDTNS